MENSEAWRIVEALLFAAAEPMGEDELAGRAPEGTDVAAILAELYDHYATRGVNLVKVADKWMFQTAPDLAFLLRKELEEPRKLSRAAVETLAIIAYHQPVTRAEIEEIRGVGLSKGTIDVLMEAGWVKPRGRKRVPGRPLTYGTTADFLVHFGLSSLDDLPGVEEMKAAGLLENVNLGMLDFSAPGARGEDDPGEEELELPGLEEEQHETAAE